MSFCDPSWPPCADPGRYTSVLGAPNVRDGYREITPEERRMPAGWRGRQMKEYEQTGRLPAGDLAWYRQHGIAPPLPGNWCGVPAVPPGLGSKIVSLPGLGSVATGPLLGGAVALGLLVFLAWKLR